MIIYRSHRGSLEEAMKTVVEFDNLEDLKLHVCDEHNSLWGREILRPDDIIIGNDTINDTRIGWKETRHVLVKRMGNRIYEHPQCVGFCWIKN